MRFWKDNWYYNIVGNVIGTLRNETRYEGQGNDPYIYRLVYELDTSGGYLGGPDGNTKATMLRHGNWDSFHNRVLWDAYITDYTLPASYYLSAKPAFFGACGWPALGTDLSPMVNAMPAWMRYHGYRC